MDALAHCLEAYCAPSWHPMAEGIAVEGMRLVKEALPRAYRARHRPRGARHDAGGVGHGGHGVPEGPGRHPQPVAPDRRRLRHPSRPDQRRRDALRAGLQPAPIEPKIERARGLARHRGRLRAASSTGSWPCAPSSACRTRCSELGVPTDRFDELAAMAVADPTAGGNPEPLDRAGGQPAAGRGLFRGRASSPAPRRRAAPMHAGDAASNSLWVLLTRLVMRAANFAVFLLLARSLSVGEFGFYGYVMSTALVLAIAFDLGLRQSGRLADRAGAGGRSGRRHAPDGAVAGAGSLGVLACWLMLEAGGYVAGYGALALVAALNVAPMLCLRTGQGVFLGRGDLGRLNRSELISRAVMLAGTVGLWALGRLDLRGGDLGAARRPCRRRRSICCWQIRGGTAPGHAVPAAAGRPHAALRRRAVDRHAAPDPARAGSASGSSAGSSARMRWASISARSAWARSWSRSRPRSAS